MTIEELRSAMRRKVVPEEVVPQNVISCLIDEDAEPPKPDAFTFLMRLRALGIGSTDFVNLLEGCGAPDGVVARIKQNPAMNLQGLILTLENSELDSDDYTRMLLTARQVWERTLTLRLEKSETLSHIIDEYEKEAPEEPPETSEEEPEAPDEIEEPFQEEEYEEEFDPQYDEDMREMSFTAVFEKISAEIKAGKITPSESEPDEASDEAPEGITEKAPAKSEREPEPKSEADDNVADLSFTAAFDKIKAEKKLAFAEEIVEKTEEQSRTLENTLDNILEKTPEKPKEKIEEKIEEKSEKMPEPEPIPEPEPEPIKKPAKNSFAEEIVKTARQKERNRILEEIRQEEDEEELEDEEEIFDEEYDDYDEEYDDDYDDKYEDEDNDYNEDEERRSSRKGAVIWAASGAAILICAGAIIGVTLGKNSGGKGSKSLDYAKNNSAIFEKIAAAYGADTPGGSNPSELSPDYSTLFGDLLISGESGSSLGSFTLNSEIYSVTEEAVSANIVENGTLRSLSDVTAPEKTRFVAAFDEGGKLYALFSGKQSGFVKISGGKAEYTVKQDGVLTDYEFADGEMKLGTVYTPVFTETFMVEDESVYLPKAGAGNADSLAVIPAESIVMTDTAGYSYGVSAAYSTENGERKTAIAVIGNPVSASADGRFALNSNEEGLLVNTNGKKPTSRSTEKLIRATFCKDGGAILEEKTASENSDSNPESYSNANDANKVTLLNSDLKPASILSGVPEKITGMWFDGAILTINGEGSSILRVDCAQLEKPNPLTLKTAVGVTAEHSAMTFETNGSSLVITRYDLENGKAVKLCEYAKELPSEQLATVKLGDPKTAVVNGSASGIAYGYFDGISVVSEYVVFASGQAAKTETLFDDSTGFTAAFANGGKISAVCGEGVKTL